jgi:CelD/BcsL family acetyltransferase involved in cellulose biosynthesis
MSAPNTTLETTNQTSPAIPDKIYAFDPLKDARWDSFVNDDPRSSVFHAKAWLLALNRTYQYRPIAFTTSAPGEILQSAIVFCRVKSWLTGKRLVSLPFSDHCEPLVAGVEQLNSLLLLARNELQEGQIKYIDIRPLSLEFTEGSADTESYFLHVLDLRPSLEELYKKLHGDSIRRKIQRAEREKLELEIGSSEVILAEFYNLHVVTRQRQQLPPHPRAWFRNVLACLGKDAQIRVARKDGVAIASIFSIAHKQKMVYKYGCSDAHSHNLGGMQFVFWDLIRKAKENGFTELDFGRSECSNTGLVTFKDRWGGQRQTIRYLRYPHRVAAPDGNPSIFMDLGKKVFSRCPQSVLRLAGNLLYPHVG